MSNTFGWVPFTYEERKRVSDMIGPVCFHIPSEPQYGIVRCCKCGEQLWPKNNDVGDQK